MNNIHRLQPTRVRKVVPFERPHTKKPSAATILFFLALGIAVLVGFGAWWSTYLIPELPTLLR